MVLADKFRRKLIFEAWNTMKEKEEERKEVRWAPEGDREGSEVAQKGHPVRDRMFFK